MSAEFIPDAVANAKNTKLTYATKATLLAPW